MIPVLWIFWIQCDMFSRIRIATRISHPYIVASVGQYVCYCVIITVGNKNVYNHFGFKYLGIDWRVPWTTLHLSRENHTWEIQVWLYFYSIGVEFYEVLGCNHPLLSLNVFQLDNLYDEWFLPIIKRDTVIDWSYIYRSFISYSKGDLLTAVIDSSGLKGSLLLVMLADKLIRKDEIITNKTNGCEIFDMSNFKKAVFYY